MSRKEDPQVLVIMRINTCHHDNYMFLITYVLQFPNTEILVIP